MREGHPRESNRNRSEIESTCMGGSGPRRKCGIVIINVCMYVYSGPYIVYICVLIFYAHLGSSLLFCFLVGDGGGGNLTETIVGAYFGRVG